MANTDLPAEVQEALTALGEATKALDASLSGGRGRIGEFVRAYTAAQDKAREAGATEAEIEEVKRQTVEV